MQLMSGRAAAEEEREGETFGGLCRRKSQQRSEAHASEGLGG